MAIEYGAGEKYCLKNDSQDMSRLNIIFETFNITSDATISSLAIPTTLKVVLGYTITALSGADFAPIGTKSTLVPVSGVLTISTNWYKTSDDTLANIPADVDLKVVLIGLSY